MKKTFNYLAITSCLLLSTSLAQADSDLSQHPNMQDKMFKAMDVNSDGRISRDEFMNYDFKLAEKYGCKGMNDDARNSDGSSREWSDTSRERSTSSRTNSPSEKEKYAGTGVSGLAAGGAASTDGAVMDTNSDGRVTREEYTNYGRTKFQQMDSNRDGEITSDEMKAGSTEVNRRVRSH